MYLTLEQMENLSTKRLLTYKKKYLNFGSAPHCESYCSCFKIDPKICEKECPNTFKELKEFYKARDNILKVLSTREHVERRRK